MTRFFEVQFQRFVFFAMASALVLSQTGLSVAAPSKNQQFLSIRRFRSDLVRLTEAIDRREYARSVTDGKNLLDHVPADPLELRIRVRKLLGAAQLATGQYRAALETLLPARQLAMQIRDVQDLGSLNNNLAWIYLKMDRPSVASVFAEQALEAARTTRKYDVPFVILNALISAKERNFQQSDRLFLEAINKSLDAGDLTLAATAWNFMGRGYTGTTHLSRAESALTESFRLRKLHHLADLEVSMRDLAEVVAERGDLRTSNVLLDEAVASMGDPKSTTDTWGFLLDRGRLRMMENDLAGALPDLRAALNLARRLDVIPTDDDRVTFEAGLAELYSLFIDCGNRLYLQTRDPRLKEETFEVAEENRAASLRALVPQPHDWRNSLSAEHLSAEHAEVLEELQRAEQSQLNNPERATELSLRKLRTRLDAIESRGQQVDNGGAVSALRAARNAAGPDTAVLSFHLGRGQSWVWLIEDNRFEVYPLAAKQELAKDAEYFRDAIRGRVAAVRMGDALGEKLLAELPASVHGKHRWIVTLDGELFDLPLAAIRWNGRYLAEDHALLVTPGIRLLEAAGSRANFAGRLTAIGDPVYNRADPRWRARSMWQKAKHAFGFRERDDWHLARLTGSGQEVRTAVEHWGNGKALIGADATKENYLAVYSEHPAIVHLATHVIRAARDDRSGIIVFGLNAKGEPDFLGMREILLRPFAVKLVVMSGCASGDAKALPASGLMGLTRAWLGAGVQDVLATRWASLDDNGPFFASFYDALRSNSNGGAAEALRLAQVEMIQSHSFRNSPEYWASYFLIGRL